MAKYRHNYKFPDGTVAKRTYERIGELTTLKGTDGESFEIHVDMRVYKEKEDCRKGKPWDDRLILKAKSKDLPKKMASKFPVVNLKDVYEYVINPAPEYNAPEHAKPE